MAEVKQVDRDAAADMWWATYPNEPPYDWQAEWLRDGSADHGPVVQAFAAHREAAEKAEREACAKVAEDCMKLISIGTPGTGPFTRDDQVVDEVTAIIATAIRARGDGGGAMDELIARDADLI